MPTAPTAPTYGPFDAIPALFPTSHKRTRDRFALAAVKRFRRYHADYLAECESDRRQGYRPHYCEHGTNQWTDYDNICGPCEDGRTHDYGPDIYRDAIAAADTALAEIDKLAAFLTALTVQVDYLPIHPDPDAYPEGVTAPDHTAVLAARDTLRSAIAAEITRKFAAALR
jgi:hypothetical protein